MELRRLISVLIVVCGSLAFAAATHAQGMGGGMGSGGDGGGGDIATNDILARWGGPAVEGIVDTPRTCFLAGKPQPNGTHTAYTCVQESDKMVRVNLTGGFVIDTKGTPSQDDRDVCLNGFAFDNYPNSQYIVAVGGGEICTDGDGCPINILNVISTDTIFDQIGFTHFKMVGTGNVPQSTNLNPLACPANADGSPNSYDIESIEVQLRNGGNKAELVCLFSVEGTKFEVTPKDCP